MKPPREIKKNNPPKRVTITQEYHGQLPPPSMLADFNKIDPGFAERIFKMAEEEQQIRHNTELYTKKHITRTAYLGVIFAFLSVLIISSLVFYALYKGLGVAAATIATGSIAAVAGVFIFYKRKGK